MAIFNSYVSLPEGKPHLFAAAKTFNASQAKIRNWRPRITTENLNKQRCRCRWTSSHHHSWGIRSGENWKNRNPTWQRLKSLENSQLLMVLCRFWVGYVGCGMATSPKKVDVSSPDQFSVPSNSCHPQHASKQLFTHHARHFGDIDHWVHWHLAKFGRFSWIVN